MKHVTVLLAALAAPLFLNACTSAREQLEIDRTQQRAMGAEPLAERYNVCATPDRTGACAQPAAFADVSDADAPKWLGAAAGDSYKKCQSFLARLAYGETAWNTGLDIVAVGLAGAGAITVPIKAAQTLSALAGITTATKATIDSDVFMQNAAPVISQKISTTYMADLKALLAQTAQAKAGTLPAMYAQLLTVHGECTLMSALASLGTGTGAGSSRVPLQTTVLAPGATISDPIQQLWYKIGATDQTGTNVTYKATKIGGAFTNAPDMTMKIADFMAALNADGAFVTATQ